jgi:tRNA A-37 threonylcarbamoyl transferase component Bud32
MPLIAGDKLGPYEILAPIGAGGMGEVYKARDTRLGREVAIKTSAVHFSERFEREARVVASLNHPNICTLFDIGPNYLVMEYIEGESPKGPLPLATVLDFARQMADALDAAHENGITHRDLKPANIKITPEGKLKILDFGLAKVEAASNVGGNAQDSPTLTMNMTQAGMILGTAAYMAPEQAKGKFVDKRADIWAFGVILHELCTGERLFEGSEVTDILASVLKDQPSFEKLPSEIVPLLKRCLQKDPKRRLRDIADAQLLLDAPPVAARPESPGRNWIAWAIAAALGVAAVVFAALWLRPAPPPAVTRFEIHPPAGSTLPLGTPAPSPDGRSIAYTVSDAKGTRRIYLRRMDRTEAAILPGTEDAQHPFWSPDGRSIAFFANNAMRRTEIDGGLPRVIAEGAFGAWQGDWNQYGDILISNGQRLSANGGPATSVPSTVSHPAFLPDGKHFLFRDGLTIRLGALDSKNAANTSSLVLAAESAPLLATVPNGKTYLLFLREPDLFAVEFDLKAGQVRGDPVLIVANVGRVASPPVKPAAGVSRNNGVLAFQMNTQVESGELVWVDRAGKRSKGNLPTIPEAQWLAFSPDGRMVGTRQGADIWVTDLTRGSSTRLTTGGKSFGGVWSLDGSRIAFSADNNIMAVRVDGSGEEKLLEHAGNPVGWSAGGLVATQGLTVSLHPPPNGKGQPITFAQGAGSSTLAPGGNFLAYTSRPGNRVEVFVQALPPATGRTQISVNGGTFPHWRGDGKELFFETADGAMMAVDTTLGAKFTAGIPHELFRFPAAATVWDVTPDGQRFLMWTPPKTAADTPITVVMNWWTELGK